jgi:hypothetical protein
MVEFSMTKHSADPNQTYLARIRKLIHFTVRIQKKRSKQMQKSKEFFIRSVFMLKLTTPEQNSYFFYYLRYADPKKIQRGSEKILTRIRDLFYTKRADPKFRIGTKHEAVPKKFRGMVITSWYGTVPH